MRACAVGGFSIGNYTFSCATDCGAATCELDQQSKGIIGTLPDVFDKLTCAPKITAMYLRPLQSRHV